MHSIVTTFRGAVIKVEVANFCAAMDTLEVANFCAAMDTLIDQDAVGVEGFNERPTHLSQQVGLLLRMIPVTAYIIFHYVNEM